MATETLVVDAIHVRDDLNRMADVSSLLSWIEDARRTLHDLSLARQIRPDLSESLASLEVMNPREWQESQSNAIQWLHELQADSMRAAERLIGIIQADEAASMAGETHHA